MDSVGSWVQHAEWVSRIEPLQRQLAPYKRGVEMRKVIGNRDDVSMFPIRAPISSPFVQIEGGSWSHECDCRDQCGTDFNSSLHPSMSSRTTTAPSLRNRSATITEGSSISSRSIFKGHINAPCSPRRVSKPLPVWRTVYRSLPSIHFFHSQEGVSDGPIG